MMCERMLFLVIEKISNNLSRFCPLRWAHASQRRRCLPFWGRVEFKNSLWDFRPLPKTYSTPTPFHDYLSQSWRSFARARNGCMLSRRGWKREERFLAFQKSHLLYSWRCHHPHLLSRHWSERIGAAGKREDFFFHFRCWGERLNVSGSEFQSVCVGGPDEEKHSISAWCAGIFQRTASVVCEQPNIRHFFPLVSILIYASPPCQSIMYGLRKKLGRGRAVVDVYQEEASCHPALGVNKTDASCFPATSWTSLVELISPWILSSSSSSYISFIYTRIYIFLYTWAPVSCGTRVDVPVAPIFCRTRWYCLLL